MCEVPLVIPAESLGSGGSLWRGLIKASLGQTGQELADKQDVSCVELKGNYFLLLLTIPWPPSPPNLSHHSRPRLSSVSSRKPFLIIFFAVFLYFILFFY